MKAEKRSVLRLLGTSKSTTLINFIQAEWKIKPFSLANTFVTYPYISWPLCSSETVVLKMNNMEFVRNVMLTEGSDHSTFSWSVTLARERAWEWERQTDRRRVLLEIQLTVLLITIWQYSLYISTDVRVEGRGGEENWQSCKNVVMKHLRLEPRFCISCCRDVKKCFSLSVCSDSVTDLK